MADLKVKEIPLTGRWRKSTDPLLLDDSDLSDIESMRYTDRGLKSVAGMTKINSSPLTTYTKIRSGFHYAKDEPSESHVLVQAWNAGKTASNVYQNTTAIPSAGDFSATVLLDETGATVDKGRFSDAPQGQLAYCNGHGSYIWAGTEIPCAGFVVYDSATDSISYDYTPKVRNKRSTADQVAAITKAADSKGYLLIGATRPIDAIKLYVSVANATAGIMSGTYWDGTNWTALGSISDGTSVGGVTLAQTGTVTFTAQAALAKPSIYKGILLYWYKIELSAVDNATRIYYCTVRPTWTTVRNLWDGQYRLPAAVKRFADGGARVDDYTLDVNTDAPADYATNPITMPLDGLVDTSYVVVGFAAERMRGLLIRIWQDHSNNNAATLTVSYWSGAAWVSVGTVVDGTLASGKSLNQSGIVSWEPPASLSELPRTIEGSPPLYYYKLSWSAALDSEVDVDRIMGIVEGDTVGNYAFPVMHQQRLWLFDEVDGSRNSARFSSVNSPEVWNGNNAGTLYFGDEKKITAAASFFTRFGNAAGYSLVVTKQNQVWLVEGTTSYQVYKVTETLGCPSPMTIAVADIGHELIQGVQRQVVIWMSASGPVLFDGVTVSPIDGDISNYWNPFDASYINTAYMEDFYGWYDPQYHEYHLCIVTGANTSCDTELVYSLKYRKWFKINRRGLVLQTGFPVKDTNGRFYTYGSIDTGYLFRLEYGVHFDTLDIVAYFITKDFILSGNLLDKSSIEFLKLSCVSKSAEGILIEHYADGDTTGTYMEDSVINQTSGKRIVLDLQRAKVLEAITHQFKFQLTHDDTNEVFQPLAISIAFKTHPDPTMV